MPKSSSKQNLQIPPVLHFQSHQAIDLRQATFAYVDGISLRSCLSFSSLYRTHTLLLSLATNISPLSPTSYTTHSTYNRKPPNPTTSSPMKQRKKRAASPKVKWHLGRSAKRHTFRPNQKREKKRENAHPKCLDVISLVAAFVPRYVRLSKPVVKLCNSFVTSSS